MNYPRRKALRYSRGQLKGQGLSFFTLRMNAPVPSQLHAAVFGSLRTLLEHATRSCTCTVTTYCFMPDHCHIMVQGLDETSDPWLAMVKFKQTSARLLTGKPWWRRWQERFDVRVIAPDEGVREIEAYVINNPVRKGLVQAWQDWPYSRRQ